MTTDEVTAQAIIDAKQRIDYILYAGHNPKNTEKNYAFFETFLAAENTPRYNNMKGKNTIPFAGTYKINGLGMMVEPMVDLWTAAQMADFTLILDGYLNFQVGSDEGSILKLPLAAIFTQQTKCCINGSPSVAATTTVISNSVFGGKFGFIPLPNAPRINANVNIKVDVVWDTAWGADSVLELFFYIFGKRETPVMG